MPVNYASSCTNPILDVTPLECESNSTLRQIQKIAAAEVGVRKLVRDSFEDPKSSSSTQTSLWVDEGLKGREQEDLQVRLF